MNMLRGCTRSIATWNLGMKCVFIVGPCQRDPANRSQDLPDANCLPGSNPALKCGTSEGYGIK